MSRFHIHIAVEDLRKSIDFYSAMFGTEPTVAKPDYAKWRLEDPRINFAISTRGSKPGLDHVGIQAEDETELADLRTRLDAAGIQGLEQTATTCCYSKSDKYWAVDPQGIAWETFLTLGEAAMFGGEVPAEEEGGACCTPDVSKCC